MRYLKFLFVLTLLGLLAACGGGGGSSGTTTGSTAVTPKGTPTLVVELRDLSNVVTNSVSGVGVTARATLKDELGQAVTGRLVTFAADNTLVKFSPATGQVLTDSNGVASLQLSPASVNASGAGTLNVGATVGSTALSTAFDFQLSASNVALTTLDVGNGGLAAFGNRAISVVATINGAPAANTPIQVTFQASCGTINPQTVTTDNTGRAATTFSANDIACAGSNVAISASAPGAALVQGAIAVQSPLATNLQFVDATPALIYLTGSVGATQSQLRFRVVDAAGTPLQNQSVQLSLVTNSGTGVSLNTVGSVAPIVLTTDATGLVSVAVFSGTIPTSVQVRAVLGGNSQVAATSNVLTVASGRPVQRATSLSLSKFSIEGFSIDGNEADLTMALADRQGNPVPDGTQVNFVSESGVMIPASCIVSGGTSRCSVKIRTQGARPSNGRVGILAYVPGEEDFVDSNGNNIYDAGESFTDLGNAYRDDNETNAFDSGEFTVPRTGSSSCAGGTNGRANTCDGAWGTVDVRAQANVVFATSGANIVGPTPSNSFVGTTTATVGRLDVTISDLNGNSVASGSAISVSVTSPANTGCAPSQSSFSVPNSLTSYILSVSTSKCRPGDILNVKVTSPSGFVSSADFTVSSP